MFRMSGVWQYDFPTRPTALLRSPLFSIPNVCAHGSTAEESFIGTMSPHMQLRKMPRREEQADKRQIQASLRCRLDNA